jgi:metal-responsive CopG/Arc/MetJ family transcriptional regulator
MESTTPTGELLPPGLLAEVEAFAAIEHRSACEILREAVERYLKDYRSLVVEDADPAS